MITVRDLSVKYKSRSGEILALNKVNIAMDSRELYTVIGPSGCGKSTLLHVLSGILTDFEGSVLIDGKGLILETSVLVWSRKTMDCCRGRRCTKMLCWV